MQVSITYFHDLPYMLLFFFFPVRLLQWRERNHEQVFYVSDLKILCHALKELIPVNCIFCWNSILAYFNDPRYRRLFFVLKGSRKVLNNMDVGFLAFSQGCNGNNLSTCTRLGVSLHTHYLPDSTCGITLGTLLLLDILL